MAVDPFRPQIAGFTEDQRLRIVRAIDRRLEGSKGCGLCGRGPLTLVDTPMYLSNYPPGRVVFERRARVLPSIVLVCDHCGNSHLLAMSRLGLEDLIPDWLSE